MSTSGTDEMDSLNGEGEPGEFDPYTPEQAGAEDPAPDGQPGEDPLEARLRLEAEDIRQVFPQFDLKIFLETGGAADALAAGKSLWSVFAAAYAVRLQSQAEQAALERIRSRNSNVPDVLRHGGAAGAVVPDYANMPSEQFGKMRKAYEAEMRMGRKVKP
jgi:hypothetical protein